jgi:hypothetical protein
MGRYKIYRTASSLEQGVESYFRSISRTETVKEPVPTGSFDRYGHEIMRMEPVLNDDGEEMRQRVFHIPPTRGGLCEYLGISNNTWTRYCDSEENPKFAEICEWAEDQLLNWRNGQLLIRSGKHIRGLEVEMNLNFGKSVKQTVEIRDGRGKTGDANELSRDEREALLEELVARHRGVSGNGEG